MNLARRNLPFLVSFWAVTLLPSAGWAQFGTGGSAGTLGENDIYVSVQKTMGVPLIDRERDLFLNRANCQCCTKAWVRANLQPTAITRAAIVQASATVSMYVGNSCDVDTTRGACHELGSTSFSEFRITGLIAETNVDDLTRLWSTTSGNAGNTRAGGNRCPEPSAGTGGSLGTGGSGAVGGNASGGSTGAGGGGDMGGASGTGTGGTSGASTTVVGGCDGTFFGQTVWVFVGTTGGGSYDIVKKKFGFNVDPEPPRAPPGVVINEVHEALVVSWTGLSTASVADLLGYQILCTRGDVTQVFKTGTFAASFDSCLAADTDWPQAALPRTSFVCSELLSPASTSYRVKTLENGITYGVGVVAIDKRGNASSVVPTFKIPVATRDFYFDYRNGDPQGSAVGGYCGISGDGGGGGFVATTLVGLAMLALAIGRRRGRERSGK